jgi:hypothetical protein
VPFQLSRRLDQIALTHNIVPIEHASRLPAADLHYDGFWNTGTHEVACARPTQTME